MLPDSWSAASRRNDVYPYLEDILHQIWGREHKSFSNTGSMSSEPPGLASIVDGIHWSHREQGHTETLLMEQTLPVADKKDKIDQQTVFSVFFLLWYCFISSVFKDKIMTPHLIISF